MQLVTGGEFSLQDYKTTISFSDRLALALPAPWAVGVVVLRPQHDLCLGFPVAPLLYILSHLCAFSLPFPAADLSQLPFGFVGFGTTGWLGGLAPLLSGVTTGLTGLMGLSGGLAALLSTGLIGLCGGDCIVMASLLCVLDLHISCRKDDE